MGEARGSGASRSGFQQLLEVAPDATIGVNRHGVIAIANEQAAELFGYGGDQLVGETLEVLVPESFRELHARQRVEYFEDPRPRSMASGLELQGRRRDGTEFPAQISLSAIDVVGENLVIAAIRDVTPLRRAERKFEQLLEFAPDAVVGVAGDGQIVLVNQQTERIFGYERTELIGERVERLVPERLSGRHASHRGAYFEDPRVRPMGAGVELFAVRKDGSEFPAEISLSSIETEHGVTAIAAVRDITDRAESEREKALQRQLDRARRMESVGQLAGGVAHDFNNILGVILSYAEFVAEGLPADSQARQDLSEISRAAERAAGLTRQLLIFSRREVVKPEVIKLDELVVDLEKLLQRALGERVELETRFAEGLWAIEADPAQMEQVLVNLAVNARDAMPDGGRLMIEAENAVLDEEFASLHPDVGPGSHLELKVSDTGIGMDRETVERVFEPFFTTKSEGTGLGLATVYGIVTGNDGGINVYSESGMGTTFRIHLPAVADGVGATHPTPPRAPAGRGEVILVVEDEPSVMRVAERVLSKGGYAVIATEDEADAVEICKRAGQTVDLMLTDVVMPKMLGPELVDQARALRPDLAVVYMSGYSHEVLEPRALAADPNSAFIEKPFSSSDLLGAVRELLDRENHVR